MNVYQDITLIPSGETNVGFLWQKIYTQVHLALVEAHKNGGNHAVAFPGYKAKAYPLGDTLRLFSSGQKELDSLALPKWLNRLQDYCHLGECKHVPEAVEYVCFVRKQFKSNVERLARRRAKRNNESYQQALAYFEGFKEEKTRLPFVRLQSLSNGKHYFPLYIEMREAHKAMNGEFDCYGLSKTATVPWF